MRGQGQPNVMANRDPQEIEGEFEEVSRAPLATVRQPNAMRVQTQHTTAMLVQVPRDLTSDKPTSVLNRVVREAAICGEDFIYSMTFKSKDGPSIVEGTSIDGAMVLARNYGNCVTDVDVVEESQSHWVLRSTFIDLETGFTETRLFRQSKGTVAGKFDADRKLDMAFQIGQSKAKRNVIVRAMPTWLVSKAVEAAKASAAAAIKDLPVAIEWVTKTFGGMGVDVPRLEKRIGAPLAQWNARDVVRMKATYKAIRDRQTTVADEFPAEEGAPTVVTPDQQPAATTAPTQPAPASTPTPAATTAPAPAAVPPAAVPTTPAASPAPAAPPAAASTTEPAPAADTKPADKPAADKGKDAGGKARANEPERDPLTGELVPPAREPGKEG